jgi:fumarate reductase flavoprotein subunit
MWDDAGIVRNRAGLERAARKLEEIEGELDATGLAAGGRTFNLTWHDWMNLRSLTRVSRAIVLAAQARENSRGAHFRDDFPEPGQIEGSRFTIVTGAGGALRVDTEAVQFAIVRPGHSLIDERA